MAVKALIFGMDDLYPELRPYYDLEARNGNLEIVGYAVIEGNKIDFYNKKRGGVILVFNLQLFLPQKIFIPE